MNLVDQVLQGDCLGVLRSVADNTFHAVVTDPPYGLGSKRVTPEDVLRYVRGESIQTGDFMGNSWDLPGVSVWKEVYRVLRPGGHILCFGGTRTFDLMGLGLRLAGFEGRDALALNTIGYQWLYGSGMPKSYNIAKALEGTPGAKDWEGYGSALKPSWEPILLFRKPLSEEGLARNVSQHGTGGLNINGCRVRYTEGADPTAGRWPANALFVHHPDCVRSGEQRVAAPVINRFTDGAKPFGGGAGHSYTSTQTGDSEGMESVPIWECHPDCPVGHLDSQSGERPSTLGGRADPTQSHTHPGTDMGSRSTFLGDRKHLSKVYADGGGASRYFSTFESIPFKYTTKVNQSEATLNGRIDNDHATKKPLELMRWLVRLVTFKGAHILDPYCGSGSTLHAAVVEGVHFTGIERDPKYVEVSERRLAIVMGREQEIQQQRDLCSLAMELGYGD